MKCKKLYLAIAAVAFMFAASSCDNDNDAPITFSVTTTVGGAENYYTGLTMQVGTLNNPQPIATAVVDENGQAAFALDITQYAGEQLWFCVPGMVKFYHTLTSAEIAQESLVLPDKDKGSTLLKEAQYQIGNSYYKNDWIVAIYIGINKDGNSNTPIYWATGNLLATKMNAANAGVSEVAFHVATYEETCEEANGSTTAYVGMDSRLVAHVPDGYAALDAGTQWDLYGFGDITGVMLYTMGAVQKYVQDSKQKTSEGLVFNIGGNKDYDIATAALGGAWRTPTGGCEKVNPNNELAALADDSEEYRNLKPDATEWMVDGQRLGYKYEYAVVLNGKELTVNTLYMPAAGYRHDTKMVRGRGRSGWYWSSTADPTCTPPYNPSGNTMPPVTEETTAFNYDFSQGEFHWHPHPRTSGLTIRPVCE